METKLIKNHGITLIALVITIIVLLILAAVSIAMLTGENGILTQANKAKAQTERAEAKERAQMDIITWQSEQMEKNEPSDLDDNKIQEILTGKDYVSDVREHSFIAEKGKHEIFYSELYQQNAGGTETKVTFPEQAVPEGGRIDKETTVDTGLVMIDANKNEWIWVEVPKAKEVYPNIGTNLKETELTDETCNQIYEELKAYTAIYRKETNFEDVFYSVAQHGFKDATEYNTAKNNMLKSVYLNGGFWIGRYEVGIEETYRCYGFDADTEYPIEEKPVIKANAYPYNYVRCSQAQTLSKKLATGGKKSSLMFGIQWDLVLKFIEKKLVKSGMEQDKVRKLLNEDSANVGNCNNTSIELIRGKYNIEPTSKTSMWLDFNTNTENYVIDRKTNSNASYSQLLTTGASEDTKLINIYDLEGNATEWTLEYSNDPTYPCTYRGTYYNVSSSNGSASRRATSYEIRSSVAIGFRPSLY